jgi:hypothetical protein
MSEPPPKALYMLMILPCRLALIVNGFKTYPRAGSVWAETRTTISGKQGKDNLGILNALLTQLTTREILA